MLSVMVYGTSLIVMRMLACQIEGSILHGTIVSFIVSKRHSTII